MDQVTNCFHSRMQGPTLRALFIVADKCRSYIGLLVYAIIWIILNITNFGSMHSLPSDKNKGSDWPLFRRLWLHVLRIHFLATPFHTLNRRQWKADGTFRSLRFAELQSRMYSKRWLHQSTMLNGFRTLHIAIIQSSANLWSHAESRRLKKVNHAPTSPRTYTGH